MNTIELVARAIAKMHFNRKQWSGACSKEERTKWLVDAYWQDFILDAIEVLKVLREMKQLS